MKELLSIQEYAKAVNISRQTAYNRIAKYGKGVSKLVNGTTQVIVDKLPKEEQELIQNCTDFTISKQSKDSIKDSVKIDKDKRISELEAKLEEKDKRITELTDALTEQLVKVTDLARDYSNLLNQQQQLQAKTIQAIPEKTGLFNRIFKKKSSIE